MPEPLTPRCAAVSRHTMSAYDTYEMNECYILKGHTRCQIPDTQVALTVVMISWSYIYFGLYLYYLVDAIRKLRRLPRQDNKMANLSVRLQACPLCSAIGNMAMSLRHACMHVRVTTCMQHLWSVFTR